jgi:uroporphyrinogen-III synthase
VPNAFVNNDTREAALRTALKNRRVIVTRPGAQGVAFSERLTGLGAVPVHIPVIAIAPPNDMAALDGALDALHRYNWIAFTSANAVTSLLERMRVRGMSTPAPMPRLAAVGAPTAAAIEAAGWIVNFIPERSSGAALAELMPVDAGATVLLPRAAEGLPALADGLRKRGVAVTEVVAYRTVPHPGTAASFATLATSGADAVMFTSPSTVVQFMLAAGHAGWNPSTVQQRTGLQVVCIGNTTAAAARQQQLHVHAVATEQSQEGLIDALASMLIAPTPQ